MWIGNWMHITLAQSVGIQVWNNVNCIQCPLLGAWCEQISLYCSIDFIIYSQKAMSRGTTVTWVPEWVSWSLFRVGDWEVTSSWLEFTETLLYTWEVEACSQWGSVVVVGPAEECNKLWALTTTISWIYRQLSSPFLNRISNNEYYRHRKIVMLFFYKLKSLYLVISHTSTKVLRVVTYGIATWHFGITSDNGLQL